MSGNESDPNKDFANDRNALGGGPLDNALPGSVPPTATPTPAQAPKQGSSISGGVPLPGMTTGPAIIKNPKKKPTTPTANKDGEIEVSFGAVSQPTSPAQPTSPVTAPRFIAFPGSPYATRIITMSREDQRGGIGNTPDVTSFGKRETMGGDTASVFLPNYQSFVQEFNGINGLGLTDGELQKALELLQTHNTLLNNNLLDSLRKIKPGLPEALSRVLLPQYSRGQSGLTKNLVSLSDSDLLSRLDVYGTHLRGEMLHALENSQFFKGIALDIKDNKFTLKHTDAANGKVTPLVKGHIDEKSHTVDFSIDKNVPPELRDLAIKNLVMMVASHTQQNNSNQFNINFGDNAYENLRILQLAIGVHNLHVPQAIISNYISTLPNTTAEEKKLVQELTFWAQNSETFDKEMKPDGSKIITRRPSDANGIFRVPSKDIKKMLLDRVTEDVFPAAPAPKKTNKGPQI